MPDRPTRLPEDAEPYRTIGPFDAVTFPEGLRRTHDLKKSTWGKVALAAGNLVFVWEDEQGGRAELTAPADIVVPPQTPHHVEGDDFTVSITFYR